MPKRRRRSIFKPPWNVWMFFPLLQSAISWFIWRRCFITETPEVLIPDRDIIQPLTGHLEEIRRRVIYCLVWFFGLSILSYHFVDPILNFLAKPVGDFVFTAPTEALMVRLEIAFGCGAFLAFPIFIFHL